MSRSAGLLFVLRLGVFPVLIFFLGPVATLELGADVLAGYGVTYALVGPLAGEVGVEEVGSVAVEPKLVLLGRIGERPDSNAVALSLGDVLYVALDDVW